MLQVEEAAAVLGKQMGSSVALLLPLVLRRPGDSSLHPSKCQSRCGLPFQQRCSASPYPNKTVG